MSLKRKRLDSKKKFVLTVLIPAVIFLGLFSLYPTIQTFVWSLTRADLTRIKCFAGIENYKELFSDYIFRRAIVNTTIYTVIVVGIGVVIAFILALVLSNVIRARGFFRSAYFIPVITPMIPAAILWSYMYHPLYGLINQALSWMGIPGQQWLMDPKLALLSISIMSIWKGMGTSIVILLAGLLQIPKMYYEAARIDGAGLWQMVYRITLPLMKPILLFVIITRVIGSYQVFDQIIIMSKAVGLVAGGPLFTTYVLGVSIYSEAFNNLRIGYASAQAVIMFIIVMIFAFFNLKRYKQEE